MEQTTVVFRKWPDGAVIALFPYEPGSAVDPWLCMSYMHVGQHGAADPFITAETTLASEAEYASLKAELEAIGYSLNVVKRVAGDAYAKRRHAWRAAA